MGKQIKEIANTYQGLFDFFNQEHNLTLTISEMNDIIYEVERFMKEKTDCKE